MAMVKKSISITEQQSNWIKAQIVSGHYGNESEVLRELIRERQLKEAQTSKEITAIREKLIAAEKSGFTNQTAREILSEIKDELCHDGHL